MSNQGHPLPIVAYREARHSSRCAVFDPALDYCDCGARPEPLVLLSDAQAAIAAERRVAAPQAEPGALKWTPLPEVPEERAIFDREVERLGDVRLEICSQLRTTAMVHPRGSFGAQCAIMANEVAKLYAGPQAERKALTQAEIERGWETEDVAPSDAPESLFDAGARFAERHHGIGQPAAQGGDHAA